MTKAENQQQKVYDAVTAYRKEKEKFDSKIMAISKKYGVSRLYIQNIVNCNFAISKWWKSILPNTLKD